MTVNRILLSGSLLGLVCLWSGTVSGQQTHTCLHRTLFVEVIDQKGSPVLDLKPNDFSAEVRGKMARVISATPHAGIRRMVILLDTSGSMDPEGGKFLTALRVAAGLIGLAPPQTQVALLTFGEKTEILGDFAGTRPAMVEHLRKLDPTTTPHGNTRMNDAVVQALGMLGAAGPEDALFMITDGGDNKSRTNESQLEKLLRAAGIRVFAVTPGLTVASPSSLQIEEDLRLGQVHHLEELTGGLGAEFGSSLTKDSAEVADTVVAPLLQQANDAYRLELELPEALNKASHWKLRIVNLPAGVKRAQVTYPHELLPCISVSAGNQQEK